ncbi:hypothetical protein [Mangrovibacterium lignilyticum]|uniref:hypothetical protein n=1 Tax=Mangrovibacterium lignilyticum TaxID=2668052 RepID=UPI0013D4895C|nr:hypothetical protein [Mangrovibacterium lignilyticum]
MKKLTILAVLFLSVVSGFAQESPFEKLSFLYGNWEGTGSGFGNNQSTITASYQPIMDSTYIEFVNDSKFDPTAQNPAGEHHTDKGMISYDKARKQIVIRQFNSEGYINQYVLVNSLSTANLLVFQTEIIENFMPGGSAKWTIEKKSDEEIETNFYVTFPGRDAACFGTNTLHKVQH